MEIELKPGTLVRVFECEEDIDTAVFHYEAVIKEQEGGWLLTDNKVSGDRYIEPVTFKETYAKRVVDIFNQAPTTDFNDSLERKVLDHFLLMYLFG